MEWQFHTGMTVKFGHLEYERSVHDWHGSQIPLISFDELTGFTQYQFFYMLSRNRSDSGVSGYIRAATNPDADSWVRELIDWWIGPDGYPIPERSGVLRWFIRQNDQFIWADSKQELHRLYGAGPEIQPKSLTFISAKLSDNQILMAKDPSYKANLLALGRVDRMRLLGGNWNVRATAGTMFREEWFKVVDAIPGGWVQAIRFWDRASTIPHEGNPDPDWTRGLKLYKYPNGTFCVADLKSDRNTPGQIENLIKSVAAHDGPQVKVMSQQDPGSAGVSEKEHFVKMLAGYYVDTMTTSKDKVTRAKPVSAQAEHGNIMVYRAPWNRTFFSELENFPDGKHDDIVDVLSGAFNELSGGISLADLC